MRRVETTDDHRSTGGTSRYITKPGKVTSPVHRPSLLTPCITVIRVIIDVSIFYIALYGAYYFSRRTLSCSRGADSSHMSSFSLEKSCRYNPRL